MFTTHLQNQSNKQINSKSRSFNQCTFFLSTTSHYFFISTLFSSPKCTSRNFVNLMFIMCLQKQRKKYCTKIRNHKNQKPKLLCFPFMFSLHRTLVFAPLSIYYPFFFPLSFFLSFSNHPNPTSPKQKQKKS